LEQPQPSSFMYVAHVSRLLINSNDDESINGPMLSVCIRTRASSQWAACSFAESQGGTGALGLSLTVQVATVALTGTYAASIKCALPESASLREEADFTNFLAVTFKRVG
jgi:hypothetical protein